MSSLPFRPRFRELGISEYLPGIASQMDQCSIIRSIADTHNWPQFFSLYDGSLEEWTPTRWRLAFHWFGGFEGAGGSLGHARVTSIWVVGSSGGGFPRYGLTPVSAAEAKVVTTWLKQSGMKENSLCLPSRVCLQNFDQFSTRLRCNSGMMNGFRCLQSAGFRYHYFRETGQRLSTLRMRRQRRSSATAKTARTSSWPDAWWRQGARFVTLTTGGWDTHNDNFNKLRDKNLPNPRQGGDQS